MPVTPGRSVEFARALTLVRPLTRRRLYWTARSVLVSDHGEVEAFDAVFFSIFGDRLARRRRPDDPRTVAAPPDDRPRAEHDASPPVPGEQEPRSGASVGTRQSGDDEDGRARASAGACERRGAAGAQELRRARAARARTALPADVAPGARDPARRTRRYEKGRRGERIDLRRTLRGSLRTGGDPIRLARRRRRIAPRRLVLLCDISGSMEPYARAYLQFLACARGPGPTPRRSCSRRG